MSSVPNATWAPRRPQLTPLRLVFAACGVAIGWLTADVVYGLVVQTHRLRLLTTYLLPVFAGAVLFALWRFARIGPGRARPFPLLLGGLFLAVAAGFDLFVTVWSDPELTLEGNPYIRVLLDETEHPLGVVYVHVVLTQVLFVAMFVTGWWAFLRHRPAITESVRASGPKTWPAFVKAATGGGGLTYRQWLLPVRPDEIPNPYHSVWPAALAASFGTSLFRYWAAAEWLELVPAETPLRIGVLALGVGGTLALYYGWLAWRWRRDRSDA
ncbi:MAG TPA: hypothetical protein VF170_08640 [Planctomycetaceae bacterium]